MFIHVGGAIYSEQRVRRSDRAWVQDGRQQSSSVTFWRPRHQSPGISTSLSPSPPTYTINITQMISRLDHPSIIKISSPERLLFKKKNNS